MKAAKGIGRYFEDDRLKAMQASIDLEKKGSDQSRCPTRPDGAGATASSPPCRGQG